MKKSRTFIWLLVIIVLVVFLVGCGSQSDNKKDNWPQPAATDMFSPPSGKSFRFEEVKIFQEWPLPANLVTQIEAEKLTYNQLWDIVFDWLPESALRHNENIPIYRTPDDGRYYPNRFYVHPDFDKIIGKGQPREKIGVFFVREFDQELVNVVSGEPIALDGKIAGFYIDCKAIEADTDQLFFRLSVASKMYSLVDPEDDGTSIVSRYNIENGIEGWVHLPLP